MMTSGFKESYSNCRRVQWSLVMEVCSLCYHALADTVLLIKKTDKFILGHNLTFQLPHAVLHLLSHHGHCWLSNSQVTQNWLLCKNSCLTLVIKSLNPAIYLPTKLSPPDHYCLVLKDKMFLNRSDLKMAPLTDAEYTVYGQRQFCWERSLTG